MTLSLPLSSMTVADKITAMELIWEDLTRSAGDIPAPGWHADVLRARGERVRQGAEATLDWNDAKNSIRSTTG